MKQTTAKVLIIDDDVAFCELLSEFLHNEGFCVDCANSGAEGLKKIRSGKPHLLVLDIMMPLMSGMEVLRKLRRESDLPVIVLTGRGDHVDKIVGLEMGADDYLGKPCNPGELAARIRAVLRRAGPVACGRSGGELSAHGVVLNAACRTARFAGTQLDMTSVEFDVLAMLMQHIGQVVSRAQLTEQILRRKLSEYDRSIDVHVSHIRKKLEAAGIGAVIKSVRNVGYQMIPDHATAGL